jgi:asparagine N-glycosylation enzyme membrane subunit Stt3
MCVERPGLIVRHHSFENFPAGTTPHTTALFDYLIVALRVILKPITARPLDLAGAIISPLLALLTGWFLWWWSWRARLRYRGALLLLFALSPILVHGSELGRPDHQTLLLVFIVVAVCAEWSLASADSRGWSLMSGAAWGLALWVSFYEPLILLAIVVVAQLLAARKTFFDAKSTLGVGSGRNHFAPNARDRAAAASLARKLANLFNLVGDDRRAAFRFD